jgi:hypothetical protein
MIASRRMRCTGKVACMEGKRNICRVLVGEPERYRPFRIPRSRRENNIKKDRKDIGKEDADWINFA